jgi:hypothetical protein
MPKSRLRGGSKAHRKRVEKRKTRLGNEMNKMQKLWEAEMASKLEEMRIKQEESAENTETTNDNPIEFVSDHTPSGDENKPLDISL